MTHNWLNVRSDFSVGESLFKIEDIVETAKTKGVTAICLSDTMTVSGMPKFFQSCKKAGIKPIIGVRLRIVDVLEKERKSKYRPYYMRAIVLNEQGWKETLALLSKSFDDDHFYMVPRLLLEDVVAGYSPGSVILTTGDTYSALDAGKLDEVRKACEGASLPLYTEATLIPTAYGERSTKEALESELPCIISPPALYTDGSFAESLDIMNAISRNVGMSTISAKNPYDKHEILSNSETAKRITTMDIALEKRYEKCFRSELSNACDTTNALVDLVTFKWEKSPPSLPKMADNELAELATLCKDGWNERLKKEVFGYKPDDSLLPVYRERLIYELSVIKKLNFASYFLLIQDTVNWAKKEGIYVGPARGSAAGSLIAYLIGITDVDPIRFNLLFERFINPERIDLPDVDMDFASLRREEVIEYLNKKYGEDYVAGVVNYNTLQASGALKDVCRMLNVTDTPDVAFSKLVPKEHGQSYSIAEALEDSPELYKFGETHPEVIKHAMNIEGRVRTFGKHAAGMIVSGKPLSESAVIERRNGVSVVNWDKKLAEDFGLVKMDILGLSTLDMIKITVSSIFNRTGKRIDISSIPLDDEKTLASLSRGEGAGVFQVESPTARRMLKGMGENQTITFDDIVAVNALNRPGPMDAGLDREYIDRKNGKKAVSYLHPKMEEALKTTYGVLVYQEQLMRISRDLCGFTGPEADVLRKAVGKKDKDAMKAQGTKFIEGAVASGMDRIAAEAFWKDVEGFGSYSFNLSHSVAYSLLTYICAYLKVHYPADFWAGTLTMIKDDKRATCLADMQRMGVKLLPPDVNNSEAYFTAINDTTIVSPMSAVKGISDKSSSVALEARKNGGKFLSIADFTSRVPGRNMNVRQVDNLNKVGAFARIEPGQLTVDHPDRRRDQVELMPGLITDAVVIDKEMQINSVSITNLNKLINEYKNCSLCELSGSCHPKPYIHGKSKVMIILDAPNFKEEQNDEMGHGNSADVIEKCLDKIGLNMNDVYITSFIKTAKPKGSNFSNKTLSECPTWVKQEIDILKPPAILILSSVAFKNMFPTLKGGMNEHSGKIIYDKDKDVNYLIGMNPGALYYDPTKITNMENIFEKLSTMIPS